MVFKPAAASTGNGVIAAVSELAVTFRGRGQVTPALRGVSLTVHSGEILAIVGESGSGKTVLSMSLLGLLPTRGVSVTGQVNVAGVDLIHADKRVVRSIRRHLLGAVFQDPLTSLNPTMRLGRQLTERGIAPERAMKNLRDAGIPDTSHRSRQFPHELFGGLRQRGVIGMALGGSGILPATGSARVLDAGGAPKLIVADEPTTALDVSVQAQILTLFDRLRREHGCAVTLVTHDIGVAASIADRIAVLYAGVVCEVGPIRDVVESPRHPYTAMLLQARLSVEKPRKPNATGLSHGPQQAPPLSGCPYVPRCDRSTEECSRPGIELAAAPGRRDWYAACLHPISDAPARALDDPASSLEQATPPAVNNSFAVELRNVRKTFPVRGGAGKRTELVAVNDCTLRVPLRGAVALVGESGSGKTTLLRLAAGLTAPDSGQVDWDNPRSRPQLVFSGRSQLPDAMAHCRQAPT